MHLECSLDISMSLDEGRTLKHDSRGEEDNDKPLQASRGQRKWTLSDQLAGAGQPKLLQQTARLPLQGTETKHEAKETSR